MMSSMVQLVTQAAILVTILVIISKGTKKNTIVSRAINKQQQDL